MIADDENYVECYNDIFSGNEKFKDIIEAGAQRGYDIWVRDTGGITFVLQHVDGERDYSIADNVSDGEDFLSRERDNTAGWIVFGNDWETGHQHLETTDTPGVDALMDTLETAIRRLGDGIHNSGS